MKAFNKLLNTAREIMSLDDGVQSWVGKVITNDELIVRRHEDGRVSFDINPDDPILMDLSDRGQTQLMECYSVIEMIKQGPKVLNVGDCYVAPLLNTDLNLTITDYSQPYKAMCVNLPPQFMSKYIAEYDTDICVNSGTHCPESVLVIHDIKARVLVFHVMFSSHQNINSLIIKDNEMIEQLIDHSTRTEISGSAGIDSSESIVTAAAIKIALNALLLADNNLVANGPYNKSHYDRLVRNKAKNGTPAQVKVTDIELATHPFVFEIDQNVQTYNKSDRSETDGSRGSNKPHWRRGHYRMQRFGPELVELKRIRILPVLVNHHLFLGNNLNSKVEYELNTPIQKRSAE